MNYFNAEVIMSSGNKLFGKRIKELREAEGFTQEQLAEKVGLEYQTISRIETGYYFTSYENLEKIARALNTNIHDLFDYEHFYIDVEKQIYDILKTFDRKALEYVLKFLKIFKQLNR